MEDNRTSASQRNKDFGKLEYGCHHYRRRCKIRAPCCNQIFPCRHCHNDAASSSSNPKDHHELIRQDVNQVTCLVCETEQEVSQTCSSCGVNMGEYFCNICKFFDDDTTKGQFHCDDCGICRVGGRDNFFHCPTCGSCYAVSLRGKHKCVKNSMKNYCPICYEYLFDSIKQARPLTCGHTMHMECSYKMAQHNHYRCPICSKSAIDMASLWKDLDEEIEATPMPEEYQFEVPILCNDCNIRSKAPFHIFGHKCTQCKSYNTRKITAPESNDSK